jgi:hypothetical protein
MAVETTTTCNSKSNYSRDADYHLSGIPLEKQVSHWLMFKMKLNSLVDPNDFNPAKYPNDNHNIVDIAVSNKLLIECTNPKPSTEMNDSIMQNKLDYFTRKDPAHLLFWVLVVSFANFSEFILNKIKELNIILVTLNIHADQTSHSSVIKQLFKSKLYGLIKRLFKSKFAPIFVNKLKGNNQLLDKYVTTAYTVNNNSDITHNNLHQHSNDTKIMQDSNKLIDKWEMLKIIDRAKRLNLYDDYGFSS